VYPDQEFVCISRYFHACTYPALSVDRAKILWTYLVNRDVRLLQVQLCYPKIGHATYITEVISLDTKFNLNALNNFGGEMFKRASLLFPVCVYFVKRKHSVALACSEINVACVPVIVTV
jgi:hypothetical protein